MPHRTASQILNLLAAAIGFTIVMLRPDWALAQCPSTATRHFTKNQPVYFKWNPDLSGYQQFEIAYAMGYLSQANGSGVTFTYEDPQHPATLVFQNYHIDADHPPVNCLAGSSNYNTTPFTVTFYPGQRCGPQPNTPPPPPLLVDENQTGAGTIYTKIVNHEIGHGFGLDHVSTAIVAGSVMNALATPHGFQPDPTNPNTNDWQGWQPTTLTDCDKTTISQIYNPPPPPPPPPPPGPGPGCHATPVPSPANCIQGQGCCPCPVVIDVDGDGFNLTDADGGIWFDIAGDGHKEHIAWTAPSSDDAWLALDRNGNGVIDDGSELFGNYTLQEGSETPNGFLALAEFDKPDGGGNGDGWITEEDAVFSDLRLWQDLNHNGISEPGELFTLSELGVKAIELDFTQSRYHDQNGNKFRYRTRIRRENGAHDGHWAYDVFVDYE